MTKNMDTPPLLYLGYWPYDLPTYMLVTFPSKSQYDPTRLRASHRVWAIR